MARQPVAADEHSHTSGGDGDGGVWGITEGGEEDKDGSVMVGTVSTVIPSAVEAAAVVVRLVASVDCKVAAVVEAGTAMEAMMSTEAAVTLMVTNDSLTPARPAMELWRAEVF